MKIKEYQKTGLENKDKQTAKHDGGSDTKCKCCTWISLQNTEKDWKNWTPDQ